MKNRAAVAVAILFISWSGPASASEPHRPTVEPRQEDGSGAMPAHGTITREKACDCCQKCMAAMKKTGPQPELKPAKDGCRDCCDRCGKEKKPSEEAFPPEVMPR